jgi:hypothetical protein
MEVDAFYGFQYKKRFYVVLSQDGLPSRLGLKLVQEILKGIKDKKLSTWLQNLRQSKIVFDDSIPTREDLEMFRNFITSEHSTQNWTFLDDYYIQTQSLEKMTTLGILLNSISSQGNPYVAPYGYVLNYDDERFDIYVEHNRLDSFDDRYGTPIPVLKERIPLKELSRERFKRVIDKYEKGIVSESSSDSETTDLDTDHSSEESEDDTDI